MSDSDAILQQINQQLVGINEHLLRLIDLQTPAMPLAINYAELSEVAQRDLRLKAGRPGAIIRCTDKDLEIFRNSQQKIVVPAKSEEPEVEVLDCHGLLCPLPILHLKKALAKMKCGETIKLISTDPDSYKNIQAMMKQTNNELINHHWADGKTVFLIKKT